MPRGNFGELSATMQLDASQWVRQIGAVRRENVKLSNELKSVQSEIGRLQTALRRGAPVRESTQAISELRARARELKAEIEGNTSALKGMERESKRAATAQRQAARAISTTGRSARGATALLRQFRGALSAIGVAASGAGLLSLIKRFNDFSLSVATGARSLTDMARVTGVSSRELEVLINALRLAGVDAQQAERFFTTFSRRIGLAADDTGPAADAFKRLGISFQQLKDLDAVQLFHLVSERVRTLGIEGTELAAIFSELADVRIGGRLLPVLTLSASKWSEVLDTSRRITTSTDETTQELANQRDELEKINIELEQRTKERVADLGEESTALREVWADIKIFGIEFGGELAQVFRWIKRIDEANEAYWQNLIRNYADWRTRVQQGGVPVAFAGTTAPVQAQPPAGAGPFGGGANPGVTVRARRRPRTPDLSGVNPFVTPDLSGLSAEEITRAASSTDQLIERLNRLRAIREGLAATPPPELLPPDLSNLVQTSSETLEMLGEAGAAAAELTRRAWEGVSNVIARGIRSVRSWGDAFREVGALAVQFLGFWAGGGQGGLRGFFASLGGRGVPALHTGGRADAGQVYRVLPNEYFFQPSRDGYVAPPGSQPQGAGGTVNINAGLNMTQEQFDTFLVRRLPEIQRALNPAAALRG